MFLFQLKQSVLTLKNVGPIKGKLFEEMGIYTISDLLMLFPRKYKNKKDLVGVRESLEKNIPANTKIVVLKAEFIGARYRKDLKLFAIEEGKNVPVSILLFGRGFLYDKYPPGASLYLYGQASQNNFEISFSSAELEERTENKNSKNNENLEFGKIIAIYPQKKGLTSRYIAKIMDTAWKMYAQFLDNEVPTGLKAKYNLDNTSDALKNIHFPKSFEALDKAIYSLKFREVFLLYLRISSNAKPQTLRLANQVREKNLELQTKAKSLLSFALTKDQELALEVINADLLDEKVMYRLLQGDVGSGKTIIAFLSALLPLSLNQQVALVVPTELLALQHHQSAKAFFALLGIETAILTSSVGPAEKQEIYNKLANNEINFIVGTHSLFSENIEYHNLQYIIIDEQHKFGVEQRNAISQKGLNPDILLMSATPIPRTLALAFYSDLNITEIREMPLGRLPVKTHLSFHQNSHKVYEFVHKQLELGHQAYFVYPTIRDSQIKKLKSASSMYNYLKEEIFPNHRLALIHSELSQEEKENAMMDFSKGEIDILIATSLLEVGIDNKNATCMVIEDAQQFGLSSLHQLRGRVGRGSTQSYAFLIYNEELTDSGKQRILAMKNTNDGFKLAEKDLRIRGAGEFDGKSQSGLSSFILTDLQKDVKMLKIIKDEVSSLLEDKDNKHIELLLSDKEYFSDILVTY